MYDYEPRTTPWFHLNNNIYSIDVQQGITSIGDWSFAYCYYARMVNFPDTGLTHIGRSAFYQCASMEEILLPDSIQTLGAAPFAYCGKLMGVAIPTSVTSFGKYTFIDCASLNTIYYPGSQSDWDNIQKDATDAPYFAQANILVDTTATITWNFDSATGTLTVGGYGRTKNYNTSYATMNTPWKDHVNNIKKIVVEEGVTGLGDYTFGFCFYVEEIVLPESLVHIGSGVFYNCMSLKKINIPDSVTRIYSGSFYNCKLLPSIIIPVGVTSIEANTFLQCDALTDISYNGTKTQWSQVVIKNNNQPLLDNEVNCLVKSIEWSIDENGVLTIGGGVAMDDYQLQVDPMAPWADVKPDVNKVVIEDGIPNIGRNSFYNCQNMTEIEIPNSVTSIGYGAFWACYGLTDVVLPENLQTLDVAAFYACAYLESITIPSTVTNIGAHTFYNNVNLKTIYYVGTPEQFAAMTVVPTNNDAFLNAEVIYLDEHPNAGGGSDDPDVPPVDPPVEDEFTGWTYADGILTITENTPDFATGAQPWVENINDITAVKFAEGVTEFGAYTFEGLGVANIVLPEGTTAIPANAFADCVVLTDVTLPASIATVGENAFADAASLTTVYFDGTAEEWADVTVEAGNEPLTAASIVYTGKPGGGIELPDFDF